jgi:hypothetical protein
MTTTVYLICVRLRRTYCLGSPRRVRKKLFRWIMRLASLPKRLAPLSCATLGLVDSGLRFPLAVPAKISFDGVDYARRRRFEALTD